MSPDPVAGLLDNSVIDFANGAFSLRIPWVALS
jgi:hypothetical protein